MWWLYVPMNRLLHVRRILLHVMTICPYEEVAIRPPHFITCVDKLSLWKDVRMSFVLYCLLNKTFLVRLFYGRNKNKFRKLSWSIPCTQSSSNFWWEVLCWEWGPFALSILVYEDNRNTLRSVFFNRVYYRWLILIYTVRG